MYQQINNILTYLGAFSNGIGIPITLPSIICTLRDSKPSNNFNKNFKITLGIFILIELSEHFAEYRLLTESRSWNASEIT